MSPVASAPQRLVPGEVRCDFAGNCMTIKATTSEISGAYLAYEILVACGGGMPPHLHRYEDEAYLILDGTFAIGIDSQTVVAGPGTWAYGPRGVPHAFRNVGETAGRLLVIVWPGLLQEQFIAEVSAPVTTCDRSVRTGPRPPSRRELAWLAARAEKYGLDFLSLDYPSWRA